jgi:hypothetical protein
MADEVTPTPDAEPKRELIPIPVYTDATLPANPPRFYVYQDALHATTGADEKYVIPLAIKARFIPEVEDLPTSREQLQALATLRGDADLPEALDEMDAIDARELARKFFQAFHEKEEARLGESYGSSSS